MILTRIRGAIATAPEPPAVPRDFRQRDEREHTALLEELIDRLVDYHAVVTRTDETGLPQAIANACQQYGIRRPVVPADVPVRRPPAAVTVQRDRPPLTLTELD